MKKTLCAIMLVFAATAQAAPPVHSIKDLPTRWSGAAGDLFTRMPASFTLSSSNEVSRQENSQGFSAVYDVIAQFRFGMRQVSVKQITLRVQKKNPNVMELDIAMADDPLVTHLLTTVVFNPETSTYRLQDITRHPDHRFVLTAEE